MSAETIRSIIANHREWLGVFDWRVVATLERVQDGPLADDGELFEWLVVLFHLRDRLRDLREQLPRVLHADGSADTETERVRVLLGLCHWLETAATDLIDERVAASRDGGLAPRLVRLAEAYGWSAEELEAFEYMLVRSVLRDLFLQDEISAIPRFVAISQKSLLHFFSRESAALCEGLFEVDNRLSSGLLESEFQINDEVVRAFLGVDLSQDDILKIDGTTLADVLREEPEFRGLHPAPADEVADPEDLEDAEACDDDESDLEEANIEEILAAISNGHSEEVPGDDEVDEGELGAYRTDLEYLQDHFEYVFARVKRISEELEDGRGYRSRGERSSESVIREMAAKERHLLHRCEVRLEATRDRGGWRPRLERLVESRKLDPFERWVLITLVAVQLCPERINDFSSRPDVADMLKLWSDGLEEKVANRRFFSRAAALIRDGLVHADNMMGSDLGHAWLELDRRMLDFILGIDTAASDLVEGSHLYYPQIGLDRVILPEEQKRMVVDTVTSLDDFKRARRLMGIDDRMAYGRGLVVLFHGPSGTGKTMLANALANELGKRIFVINLPSLGSMNADDVLRLVFREARIQDTLLFFDECDSIFESRDLGNRDVTALLTEIERHDGLIVMATNRRFDLDVAMPRRITFEVEFRQPGPELRQRIWRAHLPSSRHLADDIDLEGLALDFELTGGFIKNAVLSALSLAVVRDPDRPLLQNDDLRQGAALQLRGRLRMADLERRVVPSRGLEAMVVPEPVRRTLTEIVGFEKARRKLFSEWGFADGEGRGFGVAALFHGPPGTGKSCAAEAIAFEVGKPLRVVNTAELVSKWVGETGKNIEALFGSLSNREAVLVFDDAEGLFAARSRSTDGTSRHATMDLGLLLYHVERYPGLVILTTNCFDLIDEAFHRRLRHVVEFQAPGLALREQLWRRLLPDPVPLAEDVRFAELARFPLTGGDIRNAIFRAAARAALRAEAEQVVTMADLEEAAVEEKRFELEPPVGFGVPREVAIEGG